MLLDGYVRVSQVGKRKGERFISPAVQREQIERCIEGRDGAVLGEVFEEFDESGARRDRPLLMEAIERIERGESNGLVVSRLDRFGRVVIDGLRAIQRIQEAGGTFVSVQDGLDPSTPTGKLVLQNLFSISEWYLEGVRANWDTAKERAIARGVWVARAPYGYRRDEDGRLEVVPEQSAVVREVYEARAINRATYQEIAKTLNRRGLLTNSGVPFSCGTLAGMVRSPAYRGEARHGSHRNPHAHEPIVDSVTWQKAQSAPRLTTKEADYLLAGLIRCRSCGRMMSGERAEGSRRGYTTYRCSHDSGECKDPAYARGDELEPLVEEFIFGSCGQSQSSVSNSQEEACGSAVEAAEAELEAYRDEPLLLSAVGAASFTAGLVARERLLERRILELARSRDSQRPPDVDVGELQKRWVRASWQQRRTAVRKLIDCLVVERGSASLTERTWIFRYGAGPIVKEGGKVIESFDPATGRGERLQAHRRCPREQLEKELRRFLAGRRIWPPYLEFAKSGKARLHAQAIRWGGPLHWGPRLGVRVPEKTVRWSKEVVADALEPFLEGRERWPLKREFDAAGLSALYCAARYHGGLTHWADAFGLQGSRVAWTRARIERALTDLIDERGAFPGRAELRATGLGALYRALCQQGGVACWKRKMGVVMADAPAVVLNTDQERDHAVAGPAQSSDQAALGRLRRDWLAPLIGPAPRWTLSGED